MNSFNLNLALKDRFTNSKNINDLQNKAVKCRASILLDDPSIKAVKFISSVENKKKPAKLNPKLIQIFEQSDAKNSNNNSTKTSKIVKSKFKTK